MTHTVKCNTMLRKDCSNSNFSSIPLSLYSLLWAAATKDVQVGTYTQVASWFSYAVLLCFLKESRITLQALQLARVLKTDTGIRDHCDSSALQIIVCAQGCFISDNSCVLLSVFDRNFIRSRGLLRRKMLTAQNTSQTPKI